MKKLCFFILACFLFENIFSQDFYYSANKKHYLTNSPTKFVVNHSKDFDTTNFIYTISLSSETSIIELKDSLNTEKLLFDKILPVKIYENTELIFTGEILLKPKKNISIQTIINLVKGDISIKNSTKYNTFVMNVNNWDSIFNYANKIYESGLVEYCHPNFIYPISPNSADPLYSLQYYLNSNNNIDINIPEAWSLLRNNKKVRIAVIDEGVEYHEDLENKILNGLTVSYSNDRPNTNGAPCSVSQPENIYNSSTFSHGIACAGIIAANHNSKGIKGIINNSEIVPINIFNNWYVAYEEIIPGYQVPYIRYRETANDLATAINEAWDTFGCDVLSNSWYYQTNSSNFPNADNIIDAINNALTYGREGKGSIVVFSSGNHNEKFYGVAFPANVNGVISVGAISKDSIVYNYSGRGQSLSVVAPSQGILGI